jgi:hypothetical protein
MRDTLVIENGNVVVRTEEGAEITRPEPALSDMFRREMVPPLNGEALPDGVKFYEWRDPFFLVVHQLPPHVRMLQWIDDKNTRSDYGPGTAYKCVRVSLPYTVTYAVYYACGRGVTMTHDNELYFRNEPLRTRSDRLGFPCLLNISVIKTPSRVRSWICTQHLRQRPGANWSTQLANLIDHTWSAFNRSSERHEGASGWSAYHSVNKNLSSIERWEAATAKDEAFGLKVNWKSVPMTVGELIDAMLEECQQSRGARMVPTASNSSEVATGPMGIIQRFMNFAQQTKPA